MTPVFDHLMHWVPDLKAAEAAYQAAGFPLRTNPSRPGAGVRNGAWWKDLQYIETLTVTDAEQARTSTAYGTFTQMILPAVEETLAAGGGALNLAVLVDDVGTAVRNMGTAAAQHTIRLKIGPAGMDAFTIGWPIGGPPWAPFVISYNKALRAAQKAVLPLLRRRQPGFRVDHLVVETPDPVASAAWLREVLNLPASSHSGQTLSLGSCGVKFARGMADRVTTVALAGSGPPDVTIAGLRYRPGRAGS